MQFFIGKKNYSSWFMRPCVLLRQFNIPSDEVMLRFDGSGCSSNADSGYARAFPNWALREVVWVISGSRSSCKPHCYRVCRLL